jgi:uncharacterized membrane protein
VSTGWDTSRTEAFSDGVFAIAVTLLVLDIGVGAGAYSDLWRAIADEWPAYLAYVTSFVTIGGLWMAHHGIFRRLRYANRTVMRINLALLMAVSFLPFPTSLLAGALKHSESAERAAVTVYGLTLLIVSLLFWALWNAIVRHRELVRPGVSDGEVAAIQQAVTPSPIFYAVVIGFGLLAPRLAAFGYLLVALVAVARARGDEPVPPAPRGGS